MSIEFDVYAAAAPNGTKLTTLTDLEVKEFRVSLTDTGEGRLVINRASPQATAANFAQDNVVKVRVTEVSADPIFAFLLQEGNFVAVSTGEEGDETLEFGGPGLLQYLDRAIMPDYSTVDQDPGQLGNEGYWPLFAQGPAGGGSTALGSMFMRCINEAFGRTPTPYPDLTVDFSLTNDSSGTAWTSYDGTFRVPIGDSVLTVLRKFQSLGLEAQITPSLLLRLFEQYGTDRTATVTLEKGVNILTGVERAIHATPEKSHMMVGGDNYTYVHVSTAASIVREGFLGYGTTDGTAALTKAGQVELARRSDDTDKIDVGLLPITANGGYIPGPSGTSGNFWVGDDVTLHTGTAPLDYNMESRRVSGIRFSEREAGDFDVVVELNGNGTEGASSTPGVPVLPGDQVDCECPPEAPAPGTPGTPGTATGAGVGEIGEYQVTPTVSVLSGQKWLIAFLLTNDAHTPTYVRYRSDIGTPASDAAMTLLGSVTHPTPASGTNKDGDRLWVYYLADPVASDLTNGAHIAWQNATNQFGTGMGYISTDATATPVLFTNSGTGSTSSVTPTANDGDLVVDVAGCRVWSLGTASNTPTVGSGQTAVWAVNYNNAAGQNDITWGGGKKTGSGVRSWGLGASVNWVAGAVVFSGGGTAGVTPQPIGTGGTAAAGTNTDYYAPIDHVHEHSDLSGPAETQHGATQVSYDGTTSGIAATNTKDAIDEIDGRVDVLEAAPGGLSNPMTTRGDLIRGDTAGPGAPERMAIGTAGYKLTARTDPTWEADRATINFIIDGGGAVITTGTKGMVVVDFACVIESATLLADQSGSIVVDVWKTTYAAAVPTVAGTITASAKPTLSSAQKSQDSTLTGWTTAIAAGDVLRFNVDSATTCQRVTLALKVRRT